MTPRFLSTAAVLPPPSSALVSTFSPSISLLSTALRSLILTQLLDVLLSGFELDLYDSEEWSRVWWVAERLCGRLEETWIKLREVRRTDGTYMEAKLEECWAVKRMCAGSWRVRCAASVLDDASSLSLTLLHIAARRTVPNKGTSLRLSVFDG